MFCDEVLLAFLGWWKPFECKFALQSGETFFEKFNSRCNFILSKTAM